MLVARISPHTSDAIEAGMEAAYFLRGQGTLRATFLVGNEPLLNKPHPNYWTGLWDARSGT